MGCMATMRDLGEYGSPPNSIRIVELEERVEKLEGIISQMMKSKNPSFMDFKFIKEEETRDRVEEKRKQKERRDRSMSITQCLGDK
jgi:hypothetical protein